MYLLAVNSLTEMACMAYIRGELQNSQMAHGWICDIRDLTLRFTVSSCPILVLP